MPVATAIIVAIAMLAACVVGYAVFWLVSDVMPADVVPILATVAFIVATPIAGYLVSIIHALEQSRAELAELTGQLTVARDQAKHANEVKSRFLAGTSHELRTPLNAIIGFSEIIKDELFGPSGVRRYVEYAGDIYKSGKHLLHVINDVLDLSRIESGRHHIDTQTESDLIQAIAETSKLVGVAAEKAGVRLRAAGASLPIRIRANDRMIRQILLNLLSNAVKFTPEGGSVTVHTRHDRPDGVIVEVADTGIGMTDEEVQVAMEPFGQIDSALSRRHDGTGLGLPLARAMVDLHGGTLTIRSVPQEGTTVTFTIPQERLIEAAEPLVAAV